MGKRILIVDDEEDFSAMVAVALRQMGSHETCEENDATRVVQTAREFGPDIIFMDVMMPHMDGGEVAGRLRENPATSDIPVVFVTALVGGEEAPIGGMQSGGHRFLPKPICFTELMQCIEDAKPVTR